jgi:hypothetical protein
MATKQPTRRELKTMVDTLDDLIHYSKAHLGLTTKRPGMPGQIDIWGKDVYSWGDLNNAIHRAEEMLKARNGTP